MVFFKHPKTLPKLHITANGNLIGQVSEFNFLGITIGENITWNPHIRNTSIKIARVIGILRKLKRIFPRHILRLIYNSLFINFWPVRYRNTAKRNYFHRRTDRRRARQQ